MTTQIGWVDKHMWALVEHGQDVTLRPEQGRLVAESGSRWRAALVLCARLSSRAGYDGWLAVQIEEDEEIEQFPVGDVDPDFVLTADQMEQLADALRRMAAEQRRRRAAER